jgi:hypothetical protein
MGLPRSGKLPWSSRERGWPQSRLHLGGILPTVHEMREDGTILRACDAFWEHLGWPFPDLLSLVSSDSTRLF